jgi:hypothetical protein
MVSPAFILLSSEAFRSVGQKACPATASGQFLHRERHRLPKVKRRRHVYPLSYLPYF